MGTRPNIFVILTDQQNFRMLGCTGNTYVKTSNLDRLAANGVRFDNTYCTHPLCVPSRFSLSTGRMPSEVNQFDNDQTEGKVPERIVRQGMGYLVKQVGYKALYGGKMHFPGYWSPDIGFEHFTGDDRDRLAVYAAEKIREQAGKDEPFLLFASFINPHDVCYMALDELMEDSPEKERRRKNAAWHSALVPLKEAMKLPPGITEDDFFGQVCPPLPGNHGLQPDGPEAKMPTGHRARAVKQWDARKWRLHRWVYARLTEQVDRQIGVLLDAVEVSGITGNTVIIFTSDHGDNDASHKLEQKTEFYDESARVPFIIYDPQSTLTGGTVLPDLVSNGLDLVPTVCDYVGVPVPEELRGLSLKPLVRGETEALDRKSVPVENAVGRMVVTADYKYAEYDFGVNAVQLNDRKADPGETRNAVNDPGKDTEVEACRRMLGAWFPATDNWPGRDGFERMGKAVAH